MWTETGDLEATHVGGATELEAVVYPGHQRGVAAACGERVEHACAESRGEGYARVAFDAGDCDRESGLGLDFHLTETHVSLQRAVAGDLGDRLEEVSAVWQNRVVPPVVDPGMGDGGLEAVAGICPHGRARVACQARNLSPHAGVAELVSVTGFGGVFDFRGPALEHFFVVGPWLHRRARQTTNLPSQIGIAEKRSVEYGRERRACSRSFGDVDVEALGSSKQIPQLCLCERRAIRVPNFRAGLDGVPSPLLSGEVHREIGRGGVGVCRIGFVDVHGDGIVVDVEFVQLLRRLLNGLASLEKGERCIAMVAQ